MYNNLPDAGIAEKLFKEKGGNTILRDHLIPLLKRQKLEGIVAPCLIYKQIQLSDDERIVVDEKEKLTAWKMRDFLGRRDSTHPGMLYFSDKSYTICEYVHLPDRRLLKTQTDIEQDAESFGKVYHLLRMYELDSIVGLRWINMANKASLDADAAAFFA